MRRFRRGLSLRILLRFLTALAAYTAAVFVLFFFCYFICTLITWLETDLLYRFLRMLSYNIELVLLVTCLAGYAGIFLYYWFKTLSYLESVVDATELVYRPGEDPVELPSELAPVAARLNRLQTDVRESQAAAREAEQRKNDLVVYLAHDLKTPLTSVIGYLTLLHDEQEISPALRARYLGIALDKAERLEDLINEFFEITRFNLSALTLDKSRIDLVRMLEQLVFEFQPILKEKNLTCALDAPKELIVRCDADKLQRVFDNLLRNAVNYSYENSEIRICAALDGLGRVALTFSNQGDTIPPEKLSRIFEQFYRLDTARTSKSGGAGLGLAIAKQITELHGGTIRAESADDTVTFSVTLPLV